METASLAGRESGRATLAGGCFWCTEAVFKRLKGVKSVVPGYTGGTKPSPTYEEVCSGNTGHAEAIQITFDPKIISFEQLLDVFWHLHDPTTLNRQGADVGTQYRSAIFYHDDAQKKIAEKSLADAQESGMYSDKFVSEIIPYKKFYPAENSHKDFYEKNSSSPLGPQSRGSRGTRTASSAYCQIVIDPKIQKLYSDFGKLT